MNTQKNTRGMIEASLMVAVTCIFAIVGTYIPLLTFILFFIPVPSIILGKRHGIGFVILSVVASAIIIGSLTEPLYSIFVVTLPGIIAIVMGYMMNKEYAPTKVLAGGTAAALISSVLSLGLTFLISGISTITQMTTAFKEAMEMQTGLYNKLGMAPENVEQIRASLEATMHLATMIVPAAIIMSSVFFAYANYALTIQVLKRIGYKAAPLPHLKEFSLPKSIGMGTLLIILLTMLTKYIEFINYQALVANVFVILQFVYLIQGFAVVVYFMDTFKLGRVVKAFIILFLLLNQMGGFMVAMIGFSDVFVNFRKLKMNS